MIECKSFFIKNKNNEDDIEIINIIEEKTLNNSKLLNTDKDCFNIIEKYVYDLAMIHFNRLNIEYDREKYFIEFWCKNNGGANNGYNHIFHVDKDEKLFRNNKILIYPTLSTITYLNDNVHPTIITDIKTNNMSVPIIKDDNNIDFCLSFPKKLKHIYFDGSNYHGSINISNDVSKMGKRYTLMFNIWNSKPSDIKYYNSTRINENKYNKIDNIFNFVEHDKKIYNINSKNITNEFYKMLFIKRVNINFFINNFFKSNNIILKDEEDFIEFYNECYD